MGGFLLQATIYLCAAVIAVPLARRLGLGSVLGYLIAGVIIGPVFHLVGSETKDLQQFGEFGVVMMLFVVGLELEPKALWDMRHRLIGLGGLQISLTALAITLGAMAMGLHWPIGLAVGLTLALSSTAIVLQTLTEKQLIRTIGGRASFSVLLTQDIAVIPMLALLPLLAISGIHNTHMAWDHGQASYSLVEGLPSWGITLVTIGAIAAVVLGGHYLTRPIFRFVARSHLREMLTATTLALVIGIALLMTLAGLSPALGTFLAGVVLANSEFRHELKSDIEPFKGLLLGLFFITVGAGIDFDILFGDFSTIIGLTLSVMLIKGVVLYVLGILFNIQGRDRWLFALGLAQAGEFGFVLLSFTVQTNVIPEDLGKTLSLVVAMSMMLTPALFILYEQLSSRTRGSHRDMKPDEIETEGTVIIAGTGRFGQVVNRMALAHDIKTIVLDHSITAINNLRRFGVESYLGDPTRPDLLHSAGLMKAAVLVVSIDDNKAAVSLVKYARKERPDLRIIVRAFDREHVYQLYAAGADDIVRETFDSAVRASQYMLESLGWTGFDVQVASENFVTADRHAVRELAQLYDPDIPTSQNLAYIERAKEINKELRTKMARGYAKQSQTGQDKEKE